MQIKFAPSSSNWMWTCDVWSQYLIDCVKMLHIIHSFRSLVWPVHLLLLQLTRASRHLNESEICYGSIFVFFFSFVFSFGAEPRDKRIHWLCKWYNIIHFIYAIAIAKKIAALHMCAPSAHETWKLNYPVKCDMVTATNANES